MSTRERAAVRPVSHIRPEIVRVDLSAQPGEKQIATVTPTLQIETGRLSPSMATQPAPSRGSSSGTPRIPLAELDMTSVSQRLFTSPRVAAATSPKAAETHLTSPSSLLYTQLQHSELIQDRQQRFKTERELTELRKQVELLGNLMIQKNCTNNSDENFGENSIAFQQLSEERDELISLLKEKEDKLVELRNGVVELKVDYTKDISELKFENQELTEQVERRETEYRNMETEHKKALRCIQSLKAYIANLPAAEEVKELKAKLAGREAEAREANTRSSELQQNVSEIQRKLKDEKDRNLVLEVEAREVKERNAELTAKLKQVEKIRYDARNLNSDDVEHLYYEHTEAKQENKRLKAVAEWRANKFEEEKVQLEEQVRNLSQLLETANVRLMETNSRLRETESGRATACCEAMKWKREAEWLREELDRVQEEVVNLNRADKINSEIGTQYSRISKCVESCLEELSQLNELTDQISQGRDPNLSILLGVRDVGSRLPISPATNLTSQERLELSRQHLTAIRQLHTQIRKMREAISERYSDRLADNLTSCVTQ